MDIYFNVVYRQQYQSYKLLQLFWIMNSVLRSRTYKRALLTQDRVLIHIEIALMAAAMMFAP